jgi:hypothetical protein
MHETTGNERPAHLIRESVSVRLPHWLRQQINELAASQKTTVTQLVEFALKKQYNFKMGDGDGNN